MTDRAHALLLQFTPLIHQTIRRLGLTPRSADYDDFFQELSLCLLDIPADFDGDPLGEDRYAFTAYAKRRLYWLAVDLYRQTPQDDSLDQLLESHTLSPSTTPNPTLLDDYLVAAADWLSPREYRLLEHLLQSDSASKFCQNELISRATYYRTLQSLRDKTLSWRASQAS